MRVLIVSCTFPPEPIVSAQTSLQIAEDLVRRGHEVTVITVFPNRPGGKSYDGYVRRLVKREMAPEGFKLVRCFSFFSVSSRLISRFMENISFGLTGGWAVLTARRPDVIYANTWPIIATGILSLVAHLRRIPMVSSVQDIYPESLISQRRIRADHPLTRLIKSIDGIIARSCRGVIVISETFAEVYRTGRAVDSCRVQVVSNWADSELLIPNDDRAAAFRTAKKIPQDAFVALYGGNVGAAAGVENILMAFHRLRDVENLYLVIAGEGSNLASCMELASQLSCERVRFHRPWAKDETSMVLAAADALVLSTSGSQSSASLPSKLISYMLAARPVIACALQHSDLARLIKTSGCGWIVEPDQPALLASKIRETAGMDSDRLVRMGQMGRRYALANLTREACLPKIVSVLEMAAMEKTNPNTRATCAT